MTDLTKKFAAEFKKLNKRIEQLETLFKRINRMKPSVACDAVELVVRRIENNEDLPE